jgi:DNA end-binding protein Ku
MARSVWKGHVSFGLISIPVQLYVAARYSHVGFHEIHRTCGSRIHHQLYCPYHEQVVPRDEIAMGYETEKDKYVLIEPAELKKIQPASSSTAEILQFVKLGDVDPVYFETSYLLVPDEAGRKAYALLVKTTADMQSGALAKITIHQRERAVLIRPYEHGLILHTLYYPDEIHMERGYGKKDGKELSKQEIRLGEQFARDLLKPFHPEEFRDEYRARVEKLIESKQKGQAAPQQEKTKKLAPVIDLMSALKESLAKRASPSDKATQPRKLKKRA